MLRDWTCDTRPRAHALRRQPGLITEAAALVRRDRRRQIDAVIDYFGDPREAEAVETRGAWPREAARG